MPGPAPAGLFVYAKDLERLATFYERLLGLERTATTAEIVILDAPNLQLVLHAIPPQYADEIVITTPPERREEAAYKFFFTVPSLAEAEQQAPKLGGEVFGPTWQGNGFAMRNACDPEGNLFQLREWRG